LQIPATFLFNYSKHPTLSCSALWQEAMHTNGSTGHQELSTDSDDTSSQTGSSRLGVELETSMYEGFSIATFDYQRLYNNIQ